MATSTSTQHVALQDVIPRPALMKMWERRRSRELHWLVECVAEATGTFLYTFAGAGSTAAYVLGNILLLPGLGSLLQVGIAYAVGIVLALAVCSSTSNGQFNPGITIYMMLTKQFPVAKGLRFIVAQILGAYIACLLIYVQYKQYIHLAVDALIAAGSYDTLMFTPSGPGGIFGLYVPHGATLGYVALNEFVCDFVLALVIFACTEPSNHMATPTTMPWLIALAYAIVLWGYAPIGISANAARDVGGRLAALTLFGSPANGGNYAAIAALMNIPATILAGVFYELVFKDSNRTVNQQWMQLITAVQAEHARKTDGEPELSSLRSSDRSDEKFA